MDLRCDHKKFGVLRDGVLEVKCSSRFCGAGKGVVVLHIFQIDTGEMTTKMYKDPAEFVRRSK